MGFDPDIHHRRNIRLRGYDYSQAGAYFVTVCTQDRACLFGDVVDGEMQLNDAGRMVLAVWHEIPTHYPGVDVDACVIMPNHLHGIVTVTNPVGAQFIAPNAHGMNPGAMTPGAMNPGAMNPGAMNRAPTLGEIVRAFKVRSTRIIRLREPGVSVWQRNYYEHVIRNEDDLARAREYIINNPLQWAQDHENPLHNP